MADDEGVIRCICGFEEDDGFTIQCDQCNVWQHVACLGLSPDPDLLPDQYLCEQCNPRRLDVESAKMLQARRLKMEQKLLREKELALIKEKESNSHLERTQPSATSKKSTSSSADKSGGKDATGFAIGSTKTSPKKVRKESNAEGGSHIGASKDKQHGKHSKQKGGDGHSHHHSKDKEHSKHSKDSGKHHGSSSSLKEKADKREKDKDKDWNPSSKPRASSSIVPLSPPRRMKHQESDAPSHGSYIGQHTKPFKSPQRFEAWEKSFLTRLKSPEPRLKRPAYKRTDLLPRPKRQTAFEAEYYLHSHGYTVSQYNIFGSREVEHYLNYILEDWEESEINKIKLEEQQSTVPAQPVADKMDVDISNPRPADASVAPNSPPAQTVPIVKKEDEATTQNESERKWFSEDLHRITATDLRRKLLRIRAISEDIPNPSGSSTRRVRQIGLFATAKIPVNDIIGDIKGKIIFPSRVERESLLENIWETQKKNEKIRGLPLDPSKNWKSLLASPGFQERRSLLGPLKVILSGTDTVDESTVDEAGKEGVKAVAELASPLKEPTAASYAYLAPPFVFPHPASKLRLNNGPLIVDAREESSLDSIRYVRSYCGLHDTNPSPEFAHLKSTQICNAELRSFVVVSEPGDELDPLMLEAGMVNNRLRLCLVATREIKAGEEIVLRRLCEDWVGYPCVCPVESDEEEEEEEEEEAEEEGAVENEEGGEGMVKEKTEEEMEEKRKKKEERKRKKKLRCPIWKAVFKNEDDAVEAAITAAASNSGIPAAADEGGTNSGGGGFDGPFAIPAIPRHRQMSTISNISDIEMGFKRDDDGDVEMASANGDGASVDLDSEQRTGRKRTLSDAFPPLQRAEISIPKGGKKHWVKNADPALAKVVKKLTLKDFMFKRGISSTGLVDSNPGTPVTPSSAMSATPVAGDTSFDSMSSSLLESPMVADPMVIDSDATAEPTKAVGESPAGAVKKDLLSVYQSLTGKLPTEPTPTPVAIASPSADSSSVKATEPSPAAAPPPATAALPTTTTQNDDGYFSTKFPVSDVTSLFLKKPEPGNTSPKRSPPPKPLTTMKIPKRNESEKKPSKPATTSADALKTSSKVSESVSSTPSVFHDRRLSSLTGGVSSSPAAIGTPTPAQKSTSLSSVEDLFEKPMTSYRTDSVRDRDVDKDKTDSQRRPGGSSTGGPPSTIDSHNRKYAKSPPPFSAPSGPPLSSLPPRMMGSASSSAVSPSTPVTPYSGYDRERDYDARKGGDVRDYEPRKGVDARDFRDRRERGDIERERRISEKQRFDYERPSSTLPPGHDLPSASRRSPPPATPPYRYGTSGSAPSSSGPAGGGPPTSRHGSFYDRPPPSQARRPSTESTQPPYSSIFDRDRNRPQFERDRDPSTQLRDSERRLDIRESRDRGVEKEPVDFEYRSSVGPVSSTEELKYAFDRDGGRERGGRPGAADGPSRDRYTSLAAPPSAFQSTPGGRASSTEDFKEVYDRDRDRDRGERPVTSGGPSKDRYTSSSMPLSASLPSSATRGPSAEDFKEPFDRDSNRERSGRPAPAGSALRDRYSSSGTPISTVPPTSGGRGSSSEDLKGFYNRDRDQDRGGRSEPSGIPSRDRYAPSSTPLSSIPTTPGYDREKEKERPLPVTPTFPRDSGVRSDVDRERVTRGDERRDRDWRPNVDGRELRERERAYRFGGGDRLPPRSSLSDDPRYPPTDTSRDQPPSDSATSKPVSAPRLSARDQDKEEGEVAESSITSRSRPNLGPSDRSSFDSPASSSPAGGPAYGRYPPSRGGPVFERDRPPPPERDPSDLRNTIRDRREMRDRDLGRGRGGGRDWERDRDRDFKPRKLSGGPATGGDVYVRAGIRDRDGGERDRIDTRDRERSERRYGPPSGGSGSGNTPPPHGSLEGAGSGGGGRGTPRTRSREREPWERERGRGDREGESERERQ
ncbi:hypothetical protein HDV05_000582 [Chytridiales sp. JEL 0842]|nr:hypothetical protein HDV05_000582 [Chytridiales sp. JEL 0842]